MEQKIRYKSIWCFILLFIISTLFSPLKSYAVPAYDGLFTVKQPSGIFFEARQRGDEWYNWIETKDGYGIYKNSKTGNWEYYVPSTDGRANGHSGRIQDSPLRAIVGETDPASRGIPKGLRPPVDLDISHRESLQPKMEGELQTTAVSGTIPILVIGVDYATTTATYTPADIQPRFFGSSNSVADYYNDVSYSTVTITQASESHGTSNDGLIGWLRLSGSHPYPEQYTDINTKSIARQQIAKEAIEAADPYISYASYDTDGNGIIEPTELSICIMVAGYEASIDGAPSPSVWGHQGDMSNVGYPSVDGKTIQKYAQFGEIHYSPNIHLATIGIMCHELGHLIFSLPDLYDTNKNNGDSYGVGDFDLMGTGSWGAIAQIGTSTVPIYSYLGSSPTQLSAWSKEYLSWGTVNTITISQTVSLPKTDGNSDSIFRINTTDANQYFLIENRQLSGYDEGFQKNIVIATGSTGHGGLAIYHIDKSKTGLWPTSNTVNGDETDKGVDVEEANEGSWGHSMLDTGTETAAHTNMFFFSGNNTSFTGTTTPNANLKDGNPGYFLITDISTYGDTMTATVTLPPTATTGSATDVTASSATLNGTVSAYGWYDSTNGTVSAYDTTAWFEYGLTSGLYSGTSSTQSVTGTNNTPVSISISGLSDTETYYYRIAAKNDARTTYGSETSFMAITPINVSPQISVGLRHIIALKSNGTIWGWGDNWKGQIGKGSYYEETVSTFETTPVLVAGISGVTTIASGEYHNLALKSDGTVWTWGGDNYYGELGYETDFAHLNLLPKQVIGLSNISAIACGAYHSIASDSDGTVWTWGYNDSGQLGNGTNENKNTPTQVTELTNIIDVDGGTYHTLALESGETVWAWGGNYQGQLAQDTSNIQESNNPIKVDELNDIIAIACGGKHSMSLKLDGTVWGWGDNRKGQLGYDPSPQYPHSESETPVQITGLTDIIAIAGGDEYSVALKSDGTVWTWGRNLDQLGYETYSDMNYTPTQVNGITDIVYIDGGTYHTIALKSDGTVYTWGLNNYGQLGNGTQTSSITPVQALINLGQTETSTPTIIITPTLTVTPTPTETLTPTLTPTPTATATVTPTATPTPVSCDTATAIEASPTELALQKREREEITVTVTGDGNCPVEGDTVKAVVDENSKKLIRVSPRKQKTDANGRAVFTIKARNKTGNAKVTFKEKTTNLKAKVRVTVVK